MYYYMYFRIHRIVDCVLYLLKFYNVVGWNLCGKPEQVVITKLMLSLVQKCISLKNYNV